VQVDVGVVGDVGNQRTPVCEDMQSVGLDEHGNLVSQWSALST
jgi:hypothetical protein